MKRSRGVRGVIVSLGMVMELLSPLGADGPAVKRALEFQYARWARAHTAKDIAALRRFLLEDTTPDFVFKGPRRTHTRQQELETYQPVREGKEPWVPAREYRTRIDRLTVRGDEAIALVTDHAVSVVRDPKITADPAHEPHTLTMERTNRDTWVKTATGWKLWRREVVKGEQSVTPMGTPRHR
jgi:hypothetical protein